MKTRSPTIALLAMAFLCLAPATAAARARPDRPPADRWLDVDLEGSDGYSIHISVNPRRHLTLLVSKEGYAAEYLTRDLLPDTDRVKAKLLGRGMISLRFHPRGPVRHPILPGCRRSRPEVQPGIVRGTIRFVGERDYTRVVTHQAEATVEKPKSGRCRYAVKEEFDPQRGNWIEMLTAGSEGVYLLARKYRPGVIEGGRTLFIAETGEAFETKTGRVSLVVWRRVTATAPASAFRDAHPENLTLVPPAPFSGSGTIVRTPESVFLWEGDLAVQFPGRDPLSLAGPDFDLKFCVRDSGCLNQHTDSGWD